MYSKISSWDRIVGIAITEPTAGTDAGGIRTTAVRTGNGYVLNGEKSGISVATVADAFLVFAKTNPELGNRGISAFIVPADLPGVECKGYEDLGNIPIGRVSVYLSDEIGRASCR